MTRWQARASNRDHGPSICTSFREKDSHALNLDLYTGFKAVNALLRGELQGSERHSEYIEVFSNSNLAHYEAGESP